MGREALEDLTLRIFSSKALLLQASVSLLTRLTIARTLHLGGLNSNGGKILRRHRVSRELLLLIVEMENCAVVFIVCSSR